MEGKWGLIPDMGGPTLGATGLGWEVWLDGMEITQFTYFQQAGGLECYPVTGEITYGLERLAMYLQGVESVYDIAWNKEVNYGHVHHQAEVEDVGANHVADRDIAQAADRRRDRGPRAILSRFRPTEGRLNEGLPD